jgi:hypothetical protein
MLTKLINAAVAVLGGIAVLLIVIWIIFPPGSSSLPEGFSVERRSCLAFS